MIVGWLAIRKVKSDPELQGRGRAYFGFVMGLVMTLLYALPFVVVFISELIK